MKPWLLRPTVSSHQLSKHFIPDLAQKYSVKSTPVVPLTQLLFPQGPHKNGTVFPRTFSVERSSEKDRLQQSKKKQNLDYISYYNSEKKCLIFHVKSFCELNQGFKPYHLFFYLSSSSIYKCLLQVQKVKCNKFSTLRLH